MPIGGLIFVFCSSVLRRNKIATLIKASGEEGIAKQRLTKKIRHLKKREREEILEDLIESGEIELVGIKREKTNRTVYAYRSLEE